MSDCQTPDAWQHEPVAVGDEGRRYADMIATLRQVQALAASTRTPDDVTEAISARLREVVELFDPWVVHERRATAGKRHDLPGRGHSLLPPVLVDNRTSTTVTGRVRLDRFYLGGNGAAHGGVVPLLFDEVLGRLSNSNGRPMARTAYLHVNYREITPVDTDLVIRASVDSEEGRKRYATGALYHGDQVVADAEGLFVVLLPGQP